MRWGRAGLFLLVSACGGAGDPVFQRLGASLEAWDEAGAQSDPRTALETARELDPSSVALARALARAEAEAGELAAALVVLDEALAAPRAVDAGLVWDRAVIRTRAGQLDGAAEDVRRCLRLGVDARALAADPDLAALRADPLYAALLPTIELRVREVDATEEVLLGEHWSRVVELSAPVGTPTLAAVGALPPALVLDQVVEDVVSADEWTEHRRISLRYLASEAGPAHLPAHEVKVGRHVASLAPRLVEVVAIGQAKVPSAGVPPIGPSTVVLPSSFGRPPSAPEVVEQSDAVILRWPAHADCSLEGGASGAVQLVYREGGQPRWRGLQLSRGSTGAWTCRRGGAVSASGVLP